MVQYASLESISKRDAKVGNVYIKSDGVVSIYCGVLDNGKYLFYNFRGIYPHCFS